ncbi:MAG: hypothetical protein ACE5LX_06195 [Nitrospinota bacterium]
MGKDLAPTIMVAGLAVSVLFISTSLDAFAFDFKDIAPVGAGSTSDSTLEKIGNQAMAAGLGAASHKSYFFKGEKGQSFRVEPTYKDIPLEPKLPYAIGGERMTDYTLEYAPQSYHREPSAYEKALMFFSCTNCAWDTLLPHYVSPEDDIHGPNLFGEEAGLSQEVLLPLVISESLLKAYRAIKKNVRFIPEISVDKNGAVFMIRFNF